MEHGLAKLNLEKIEGMKESRAHAFILELQEREKVRQARRERKLLEYNKQERARRERVQNRAEIQLKKIQEIMDYRAAHNATLAELGRVFGGVSRERIRQQIGAHKDYLALPRGRRGGGVIKWTKWECEICHKSFETPRAAVRKFCKECNLNVYHKYRGLSPEEKHKAILARNCARMKRYYREVIRKRPEFKELIFKRNQRAYIKKYGRLPLQIRKSNVKLCAICFAKEITHWKTLHYFCQTHAPEGALQLSNLDKLKNVLS